MKLVNILLSDEEAANFYIVLCRIEDGGRDFVQTLLQRDKLRVNLYPTI